MPGKFPGSYFLFCGNPRRAAETGDLTEVEKYLGEKEDLRLTELVLHLRRTRHPWMVEGVEQYLLAYQAVQELLTVIIAQK